MREKRGLPSFAPDETEPLRQLKKTSSQPEVDWTWYLGRPIKFQITEEIALGGIRRNPDATSAQDHPSHHTILNANSHELS